MCTIKQLDTLNFDAFALYKLYFDWNCGEAKDCMCESKILSAFPKVKTSAKSVQTSAEVSKKYYVLISLSTRTH